MLTIPKLFKWSSTSTGSRVIELPLVEVHDVETIPNKRAKALKHLIRVNHTNNALIDHGLEFHNHMIHVSGFSDFF
jgi:hypothetical protein